MQKGKNSDASCQKIRFIEEFVFFVGFESLLPPE